MKLILTTLFALLCTLLLATVATAAPIVELPAHVRVGEVFTVTLRCNCTGAEDTVWWYRNFSDKFEFVSGWPNLDADKITEFNSDGFTHMQVRAIHAGRIEIWASWLNWDGKHMWQNLLPIAVYVEPAQIYLPMLINQPYPFEVQQ